MSGYGFLTSKVCWVGASQSVADGVGPRLLAASSNVLDLERALWACFDDPTFRDGRCCLKEGDAEVDVARFFEETLDSLALEDMPRCVELLSLQRLLVPEVEDGADDIITELVSDFSTPFTIKAGFSAGVRADALLCALHYKNKHGVRLPLQDQRNIMSVLRRTLEDGTRLLLSFFPDIIECIDIEPLDMSRLAAQWSQTERGLQRMVEAAKKHGDKPYSPFGPPLD